MAKPLGRNVGYGPFSKRVIELWKPKGEMEIIPLGFVYYLIKLDNYEDRERVLLEGPYAIQGHYLTVRQWSKMGAPSDDNIESTLAWIRFLELPMMYHNEDL